MNILTIESIEFEAKTSSDLNDKIYEVYFLSELKARLDFYCSKNGTLFKRVNIVSQGRSRSADDVIKYAIQNFLDGNFSCEVNIYDVKVQSAVDSKIHSVKVELQEPYKSLFMQLFNADAWQIPNKELDNKTI